MPNLKKLPAPKEPVLEATSKEFFRITGLRPFVIQPGEEPVAIVKNPQGDTAISVHRTPKFLGSFSYEYGSGENAKKEVLPGLFKVFQHLTDPTGGATFLLRAVETKYTDYSRHVTALKREVNPAYQGFLEECMRYTNPKTEGQKYTHDLTVWAPSWDMIPGTAGKQTAALDYSTLLPYRAYGPFLRDVLYRFPARLNLRKPDPRTKVINHLDYAAPDEYIDDPRYFGINHWVFGYWQGEINPENLGPILASNLDIVIHVIYANNAFYHTAILRAQATSPEGLDKLTETLTANLGKWERITGTKIHTAFQAFVPGSAPIPESWGTPSLTDWRTVFTMMADSIRPASDLQGTMSLGKNGSIKGGSILIDPRNAPAVAITAPSKKGGKSTYTWATLLPYLPPIVAPLTVTVGDRIFDIAERYGGTVYPLNLPDAIEVLTKIDRDKGKTPNLGDRNRIQDKQHKLHIDDTPIAQRAAFELLESWNKYGRPVGLPFVFRPDTDSIRVLNFMQVFFETLGKENGLEHWYQTTGLFTAVVIDNFSKLGLIKRTGANGSLGQIPVTVANNFAQTAGDMVVNGANRGQITWILAHAKEDFDVIEPGYYNRFPLGIQLGQDEGDEIRHEFGRVIHPNSNGEVYIDQLYYHLPYEILKEVERLEVGPSANALSTEEGLETMAEVNNI